MAKVRLILLFIIVFIFKASPQELGIISNGLEIHYKLYGEGTPILILGGGPGDDAVRYESLCELLSKEFMCILVEQRGTGKSKPKVADSTTINLKLTLADFEIIREELNVDNWNVLGFSYGGYLASLYTQEFPDKVSNLILLNSMGLNTKAFGYFLDNINSKLIDSDFEIIEYWRDSVRIENDRSRAVTEIIKARMPGYFFNREIAINYKKTIMPEHFNFEMGNWIWKDIFENDLEKMHLNFQKPVLILQGRQDPLGEGVALSLSNYYKDSELFFIEKCGHYSWIEKPEEVYNLITDFVGID